MNWERSWKSNAREHTAQRIECKKKEQQHTRQGERTQRTMLLSSTLQRSPFLSLPLDLLLVCSSSNAKQKDTNSPFTI